MALIRIKTTNRDQLICRQSRSFVWPPIVAFIAISGLHGTMKTKEAVVSTLGISLISFLITVALCVYFYQNNYPGTDTGDFARGLIGIFFLPLWAIVAVSLAGLVFIFLGVSSKWRNRD